MSSEAFTPRQSRPWTRRLVGLVLTMLVATLLLPLALVVLYGFVAPVSTLMLGRWLTGQRASRDWVPLGAIAPALPRAVINAEDSRFCLHRGVDWDALNAVMEASDEDGPSRGASTIAMQTAKNIFLWRGRSYLRKALEIPLALAIDALWGKSRVMEVYLNVAEWGEGLFGAEAAARHYFHKGAKALAPREAALLASVLPNPIRFDAGHPSRYIARRTATIARRMANEDLSCLGP